MFFTLFYVYATAVQWWRLRTLKSKLNGTLNDQNALLICSGETIHDSRRHRSLENLLFKSENRIACTVVPKQKLNLNQWIAFPKNLRYFPIFIDDNSSLRIEEAAAVGGIFVLLQSVYENYTKHEAEIIQIENFGLLVGWKAGDLFEVVVRSDLSRLTKLVNQFARTEIDVNHELKLLKVETVDVEGTATVIKYEKKYLKSDTLKYSYAPVHWNRFVSELKSLNSKIRDITNPKIKIENGSTKLFVDSLSTRQHHRKDTKKIEPKKSDDRHNTLDVTLGPEHKRPHKQASSKSDKRSREVSSKPKHNTKGSEEAKKATQQQQQQHKRVANKLVKQESVKDVEGAVKADRTQPSLGQTKPPNILVYADSLATKDNVKRMLYSILNKEKYVVYDLPTSAKQTGWNSSTILVVVCGGVPPDLTSILIRYFLNGGRLLCLCSDLMYSVLHTFTTAEVREHELVRFSYGSWERVKMMHHIFCYQASPAKKQFSKDSDQSNHSSSNGSSPLAPRTTPSNVELRHDDKDYDIRVQVLGTEETWHTPSLLLAEVATSKGRAVFSQVHLEIDPDEYENDEEKYRSLLSSNEVRLEILKDILATHLDLACDDSFGTVRYTPAYFLGRYDAKTRTMSECESIVDNQLTCEKIGVVFCSDAADPGIASNIRLPVLIHSCPPNFSTLDYFETLATEHIGRLVIYADILTSSQHVLTKKLTHGLAVIARQQTHGTGRSNNTWLSPVGCAALSLQLHVPLDSVVGQSLSLIQHLIMVAVVSAIRSLDGYEDINLGIKWPNDLYADASIKIGGVVVNSTIYSNLAIVNVGCGVNLSNQNPTLCINDIIERANKKNNTSLRPITYERYFALVFNEIERLYTTVQSEGVESLLDLYYKYWLHSDAEVTIQTETLSSKKAKVVGIDQYGFLSVRIDDGKIATVQPDGNSFDMMSGLIAPKI